MQRIVWQGAMVLFLFLISGSADLLSQVPVERSKDRVVIAGIPYYIHSVKKGETLYSVSKAYDISTEELIRENPDASGGLREGQNLRIRASLVRPVQPEVFARPQVKRDEGKFIYHKLKQGETIYFLSRTYNVSENEIMQSNPGVDIIKLPLGYEIAIPRKISVNEKQPTSVQKMVPYYHKVLKGETLTSIARQYKVSVRELRRENRGLRFPQVGDFIRIPGMKVPESTLSLQQAVDTIVAAPSEAAIYAGKPAGFTPVERLSGSLNVAVLLPFYLNENSKRIEIDTSVYQKGKRVYNVINRPDDWIYPRSLGFVEMYEGILLAADTLRSLGLNVNLNVWDIKSDTADAVKLIQSGSLEGMDLIIGPVFSGNLAIVAAYAGPRGIPVVSPVQLNSNSLLLNNPTLFLAYPSTAVAESAIAGRMVNYRDDNIVLLHSEMPAENQDLPGFRTKIRNELGKSDTSYDVALKDFVFYSRSAFGNDSINRFARILSADAENVVIIASEDDPVMSESLTEVHSVSRKYKMQVFGYPAMRYLDNFDIRTCFDLGLMIYSPYWIDTRSQKVIRFNSLFRDKFFTLPAETSYAWDGYDIAYYFMSGLAMSGKDFIVHPELHRPALLHADYDFRRNSTGMGFENQKLFLIRYTGDYDLELVTEPDHDVPVN
ncbi:MAG: LysM peptidoglycan-binding domain-containing protein [Bacteroidales bacterium]